MVPLHHLEGHLEQIHPQLLMLEVHRYQLLLRAFWKY